MNKINGPYGSYQPGSVGATLNALVNQENWSTCKVDQHVIGNNQLLTRGTEELVATFEWTGETVTFNWVK